MEDSEWQIHFYEKLEKFLYIIEADLQIDAEKCFKILKERLGHFATFCRTGNRSPDIAYWISPGTLLNSELIVQMLIDEKILSYDGFNDAIMRLEHEVPYDSGEKFERIKATKFLNLYSAEALIAFLKQNKLSVHEAHIEKALRAASWMEDLYTIAPILELCYYTRANSYLFDSIFAALEDLWIGALPAPKSFFILSFVTACGYYVPIDEDIKNCYPVSPSFFITIWMLLFHQIIIMSTPSWGAGRRSNPPCMILQPAVNRPETIYQIVELGIRDLIGLGCILTGQKYSEWPKLHKMLQAAETLLRDEKTQKKRNSGITFSAPCWDFNFYLVNQYLVALDRTLSMQINGICDPEFIQIINGTEGAPEHYYVLIFECADPNWTLEFFYAENAQEKLAQMFAAGETPPIEIHLAIKMHKIFSIDENNLKSCRPFGLVARIGAPSIRLLMHKSYSQSAFLYHSSQQNLTRHCKILGLPSLGLNLCMEIISPTMDGEANICSIANLNMTFLSLPNLLREVEAGTKGLESLLEITRFVLDIISVLLQYHRHKSSTKIQSLLRPAFQFPCQAIAFLGLAHFVEMNTLSKDDNPSAAHKLCGEIKLQASMAGRHTARLEKNVSQLYFEHLRREDPGFAATIAAEVGHREVCIRTAIPPSSRNAIFTRNHLELSGINMLRHKRATYSSLYGKQTIMPLYIQSKVLIEKAKISDLKEMLATKIAEYLKGGDSLPGAQLFFHALPLQKQIQIYAMQSKWVTQSMSVDFTRPANKDFAETIANILEMGERAGLITLIYYISNPPSSRENLKKM